MAKKLKQKQIDDHVRSQLKPAIKRWLTGFGEEWEFSKCLMADRIYDDLNTGSNSGDFWAAWFDDQPMSVDGILKVLEGPEIDMLDIAHDTEDELREEEEDE
tara:strand:- start:4346 stop:4651 length:306 start_codon:yes stop_codon:yes gene_type:complete